MRPKKPILLLLLASVIVLLLLYFNYRRKTVSIVLNSVEETALFQNSTIRQRQSVRAAGLNEVVIVVVSCGSRQQETFTLLKSAIIFSIELPIKFIIITETQLITEFREKLEDWMSLMKNKFSFQIFPVSFPKQNEAEWRNLFKPCSAQRLFLPSILTDIDSVLYLDTDTLFVSPVHDIWNYLTKFNSSQMAALSPEHEDKNVGWYNRFARHPYYGAVGVNAGVMLLNLTRMRKFRWNDYILPLYNEYKLKLTWGDQDLINILFHYHPEKLHILPYEFNYRPDHCMYMSVRNSPKRVRIVHGSRGYFHSDNQPVFGILHRLIEEYQLGTDVYSNLLMPLDSALADEGVQRTICGKISDRFLVRFKEVFTETTAYYYSS